MEKVIENVHGFSVQPATNQQRLDTMVSCLSGR